MVVPIGNVEPDAGSHVGPVVTATSSAAVTSNVTAAPDSLIEETDMSAGTVIVGGVMSVNVTEIVNVASPVFPCPSDAVHVTVVVPTGNRVPDVGSQVGPLVTAMLSVAVASG